MHVRTRAYIFIPVYNENWCHNIPLIGHGRPISKKYAEMKDYYSSEMEYGSKFNGRLNVVSCQPAFILFYHQKRFE